MTEIAAIPPLEGIKDFWGLLDLVRDENKYRARLKALETVRDAINESIEAVGTIRKIDKLRVQTQTDRNNAASELATAKLEAAKIIKKAEDKKADFDLRVADLAVHTADMDQAEIRQRKDVKTAETAFSKRIEAVEAREAKVVSAEQAVKKVAEDAAAARGRLDVAVAEIGHAVDGARA